MEAHSSSRSVKATDDVPSNKTGRLDGNSFNRVSNTALSCSCACNIKKLSTQVNNHYSTLVRIISKQKTLNN
jgi:hypothetical protein